MSAAGTRLAARSPGTGRPLTWVAGAVVLAFVLLEVTVMPHVRIGEGIPDLVAAAIVVVGLLRGPLVGGVAGFSAGLLIELTAPIGTLGVLALLYLLVGWFAGRYAGQPEAETLLLPMGLAVGAAAFVQVSYAVFHTLLGEGLPAGYLVGQIVIPQMALTALLTPVVLLPLRRLLAESRAGRPAMGAP